MRFWTWLAVAYALLAVNCYALSIVFLVADGDSLCIAYAVTLHVHTVLCVLRMRDAWVRRTLPVAQQVRKDATT